MAYPQLQLVSHKLCPFVQRARIVLAEKSIPHDVEYIDMANKPDWFLEISPLGQVPVLRVAGRPLFESTVIIEYLNDISGGSLHPRDPYERARNRSWIEIASSVQSAIGALRSATGEDAFESSVATLRQRFQALEREIGVGPWFNGERFALVDAAFAPAFRYFEVIDRNVDLGVLDGLARVNRWRAALAGRPSVQEAVVDDYYERLFTLLSRKDTVLGRRLRGGPGHAPVAG